MLSKLWWYEFWMSQWQLIYSKTGKCTILIWSKQKKKTKPNNFTNKLDVVTHFQNKCAETNGINWRTAINWIHNIAWPLSIFIYTSHSYITGRLEWNSNLELLMLNEAWAFLPYASVFWSMAILSITVFAGLILTRFDTTNCHSMAWQYCRYSGFIKLNEL